MKMIGNYFARYMHYMRNLSLQNLKKTRNEISRIAGLGINRCHTINDVIGVVVF